MFFIGVSSLASGTYYFYQSFLPTYSRGVMKAYRYYRSYTGVLKSGRNGLHECNRRVVYIFLDKLQKCYKAENLPLHVLCRTVIFVYKLKLIFYEAGIPDKKYIKVS